MPCDRFPGTTLAQDRAEEAAEVKREAIELEIEQIMKPLMEPITLAREAMVELHKRATMIRYRSAETDAAFEAGCVQAALEDAESCIRRAVRDAVED